MDSRHIAGHCTVVLVLAALPLGCAGPDAGELVAEANGLAPALDCPTERIATVTDLHSPGAPCATAQDGVGSNLKSHHYRVACEALQGTRPPRVDAVRAASCREDDRGAWTAVEVCCPTPEAAPGVAGLTKMRNFRLDVVAPAMGRYGTASISLQPPPRPTQYQVRIASESCDVFQLHPNTTCEASGSYEPGQTSTFMVRYTPGSTHRRGGVLFIEFADPALSAVEVRLSGEVGAGESDWLSVPISP